MVQSKIRVAIFTSTNLKTSTGSTNTVLNLLSNLDPSRYRISIVLIDDLVSERLRISAADLAQDPVYKPFVEVEQHPNVAEVCSLSQLSLGALRSSFDVAIVAIYNDYGEDGRILGILECAELPYLSSSMRTSTLCADKWRTKQILRANEIDVAAGFLLDQRDDEIAHINSKIASSIAYPVIIKPNSSGASRGVSLVRDARGIRKALELARRFSEEVLIEEFIEGGEFTVGVVGSASRVEALPVVMVRTTRLFFDYDAKYQSGQAEELCPAPIDELLASRLKNVAIETYRAVKAASHARVDMIVDLERIVVLEINTFPGLTEVSIFPKELVAAGRTLAEFLETSIAARAKHLAEDN
jgi:D-alanine-D-alanine ligase